MDPAALMAMMGGQAKPEPWSKTKVRDALVGAAIFTAIGVYVWDSRGAPLESVRVVKEAMAKCGYYVSGKGLPVRLPIVNDF